MSSKKTTTKRWEKDEDEKLKAVVERLQEVQQQEDGSGSSSGGGTEEEAFWQRVAQQMPGRDSAHCMTRWKTMLDPSLIKGAWSKEEDETIIRLVEEYGPCNWTKIAEHLKGRIGKQCRERWHNTLNPALRRGPWTEDEIRTIIEAHATMGNKWAAIAKLLPGRTDNHIKNFWHGLCAKKANALKSAAAGSKPRRKGRKSGSGESEADEEEQCESTGPSSQPSGAAAAVKREDDEEEDAATAAAVAAAFATAAAPAPNHSSASVTVAIRAAGAKVTIDQSDIHTLARVNKRNRTTNTNTRKTTSRVKPATASAKAAQARGRAAVKAAGAAAAAAAAAAAGGGLRGMDTSHDGPLMGLAAPMAAWYPPMGFPLAAGPGMAMPSSSLDVFALQEDSNHKRVKRSLLSPTSDTASPSGALLLPTTSAAHMVSGMGHAVFPTPSNLASMGFVFDHDLGVQELYVAADEVAAAAGAITPGASHSDASNTALPANHSLNTSTSSNSSASGSFNSPTELRSPTLLFNGCDTRPTPPEATPSNTVPSSLACATEGLLEMADRALNDSFSATTVVPRMRLSPLRPPTVAEGATVATSSSSEMQAAKTPEFVLPSVAGGASTASSASHSAGTSGSPLTMGLDLQAARMISPPFLSPKMLASVFSPKTSSPRHLAFSPQGTILGLSPFHPLQLDEHMPRTPLQFKHAMEKLERGEALRGEALYTCSAYAYN